jgi:hypothetical protein
MTSRLLLDSLIAASVVAADCNAFAIDLIHRKSSEKTVGGEVTKNTRDGVTVTQQVG